MRQSPTHTRTVIAGITIGPVGSVLLLVIHTWPEEPEEGELVGRIVSARKTTAHERKAYEEGGLSKRLTREQQAELKSLGALRDDAIDTSDAPELLDWSGAKPRPVLSAREAATLRLDADVVGWFKSHTTSNEGYQPPLARAATDPSSPPKGMGGTRVPLAGVKQTAPSGSGPSRAILRQGGQRR